MKRLLFIGINCLSLITLSAQSNKIIVTTGKIVGKDYYHQNDIRAKEYFFSERIQSFYIDTSSHTISVQLRGLSKNGKWVNNNGYLQLYDLSNNTIKWTKKISYQKGNIKQSNDLIIQTIGGKSYCLNPSNGIKQWVAKNSIFYVDPFLKIGIGYKYQPSSGYPDILEGIDLVDGYPVWVRGINREYSWNNIFNLDDSVIVAVAAGLHSINLKTGKGWDFNTITGEKNYTETALTNVAGVALGLLTGTYMFSSGYNLARDIVSNTIIDSTSIYFASKESIVKIRKNGQNEWISLLPKDLTSKSSIFIKDSLIFIVNKGYALLGYRQIYYGTPFLGAFNLKTGIPAFISQVSAKKDPINGYKVQRDTIFMVFKDRVTKFSMTNGSRISEHLFVTDTIGELNNFIGEQVYIKTDSVFKCLIFSDQNKHFIITNKNITLLTDYKLEIQDQIAVDSLYILYLQTLDYKFLANKNRTTVIDNNNKIVAEFEASKNANLVGTKLYEWQDKSLIEIDLTNLIKNTP